MPSPHDPPRRKHWMRGLLLLALALGMLAVLVPRIVPIFRAETVFSRQVGWGELSIPVYRGWHEAGDASKVTLTKGGDAELTLTVTLDPDLWKIMRSRHYSELPPALFQGATTLNHFLNPKGVNCIYTMKNVEGTTHMVGIGYTGSLCFLIDARYPSAIGNARALELQGIVTNMEQRIFLQGTPTDAPLVRPLRPIQYGRLAGGLPLTEVR